MPNTKQFFQLVGLIGVFVSIVIFIRQPSFPTPDKLIFFLLFLFMIFSQAREGLKRFGPFIILLLIYDSFRSVADQLNDHVDYLLAANFDKLLFGDLPTVYLQNWLWQGSVRWYDFALYLPYFLHFIIPLGLGILVWKTREKYFWRVMNTFLVVAFAAFVTYLLFPAAPPWLASENHFIQPIVRISSKVWFALGVQDFPSLYNRITPNPVAAIPSLHAAWATSLTIFVYKLYGKRWALISSVYPLLIFIGTVYEGEHYVFDILTGIVYAAAGYLITPYLVRKGKKTLDFIKSKITLLKRRLKIT